MESAFPPFKAEHRYRGVYERAGFDVNLAACNSDSKSMYSSKSRNRPRMPPTAAKHAPMPRISPSPHQMSYNRQTSTPSPTSTHFQGGAVTKPAVNPLPKVLPYATATQYGEKTGRYDPRVRQNHQVDRNMEQPQSRNNSEQSFGHADRNNSEHSVLSFKNRTERRPSEHSEHSQYSQHSQNSGHSFERKASDTFQRSDQNSFGRGSVPLSDQNSARKNSGQGSLHSYKPQNRANIPSIPNSNTSSGSLRSTPPYPSNNTPTSFANVNMPTLSMESPPSSTTSMEMKPGPGHDSFNFVPSKNPSLSTRLDNSDDEALESFNDTGDTTVSHNNPVHRRSSSVLTHEIAVHPKEFQPQPEFNPGAAPQTRLSCMFQDFKKDVEDHKSHEPKAKVSASPIPQLPQTSPTQLGLARFQPPVDSIIYNNDRLTSYDEIEPTAGQNNHLNTDFHRYSNGELDRNIRNSQLSTISSIISKGSVEEDEDDEIERELAKQLESLKTNGPARDTITAASFGVRKDPGAEQEMNRDVDREMERKMDREHIQMDREVTDTVREAFNRAPVGRDLGDSLSMGPTSRTDSVSTTAFEFAPHSGYNPSSAIPQITITGNDSDAASQSSVESIKPLSVQPQDDDNEEDDIPDRGVMFDDNVQTFSIPQYVEQPYYDSSSEPSPVNEPTTPLDYNVGEFNPAYGMEEYPKSSGYGVEEYPSSSGYDAEEIHASAYIKPLSPKNHSVEEELNNLNFKIHDSGSVLNEDSFEPIEPLKPKSNPNPRGFTPFPTSEDFNYRDSASTVHPSAHTSAHNSTHNSTQNFAAQNNFVADSSGVPPRSKPCSAHLSTSRFPPGEGPCRGCNLDVAPYAKGPKKAIYSKTGELSGQWHRECFECAYPECDIHFTKSVQCYAFDDNAYCHHHYHELNNTICVKCKQGIEGECIENEIKQKWHLNCLVCEKCSHPINNDYFLINNHIFCENDAQRIINGQESYNDRDGKVKHGGLSTSDRIEKRRTRLLFVD